MNLWKKDKADLYSRMQEMHAQAEKLRYDCHDQVENYKSKYNEYKNKLKKANLSIQTLTTRVAKYELQLAAEREVGRVDNLRAESYNILGNRYQVRSSEGAMSPGLIGNQLGDLNLADYNNEFENQELNEEIKKLLKENQI